jgi:V8-like Glu-specific endopeptidase
VHDLGSTNGTFVNGERITGERRLAAGDTIAFGAKGPTVEVRRVARADTEVRIAAAVRRQTASLKRGILLGGGALVALGVMGAVLWQRQASARERELLLLKARGDSAAAGQAARGDSVDVAAIHDRNDAAIALVASDLDGAFIGGTAFGISAEGLLVTNRHVVRAASGRPARRLRVIFANTTEWLPAHLVRTSDTDDLALIQLDQPGRYPVVAGVSRTGARVRVGTRIATIGYPLVVDTPMEGEGLHVTARTTTTAGTVSKQLDDVLQIDSYAGNGSSGSPVFDAEGVVIGVVFGGAPESNGRIVYAVPGERLARFLRR